MKNIKTFEDLVFYDWYMKGAFQMLLRLNEEAFMLNAEKMTPFQLKKLFDLLLKDRMTRDKFMNHDYDCIGIRNHKYKIDKRVIESLLILIFIWPNMKEIWWRLK